MLKGFQNEVKMDAEINGYRKERSNNMPKSPKYHQNGDQNRRKVDVAFLKRFWNGPWAVSGDPPPRHLFLEPFWEPFSTKSRKNCIQKGMQNSMSKKYRKLTAKAFQNDAKMDAKIIENSTFSEKG